MRRFKRTPNFEIALTLKNDTFLRPPRDAQRSWVVNQAIKELADELDHLHTISTDFVPGVDFAGLGDRRQGDLSDEEIMEDWQIPIMEAMANAVVRPGDAVLEVGFGRGVASDFIQRQNPESHTIIECNDAVVRRFEQWRGRHPDRQIQVIHALWQDAVADLHSFDAILFHTYPLDEADMMDQVLGSITFAEHFFDTAARLLKRGGRFTYLTNEADSLSRGHQRALLERFDTIQLSTQKNLDVPDDTKDAMWARSMVIVVAGK